ncbi:4'-phosphopantetheinyl transferase superfamily protein [Corallincola luteus]|uniref:Enterobactin synthase component D n=1 Tax=Corallincola luteus TaxID=1775177 RepID=A0ABY2AL98_9GAMM|nr:4'-phosphopantetheinyl transferase superfamily protein [Corallincola luteus]TCI03702.1 4'-phosphopantetheinyl transferase superfamily protein [Corallincola luteus]
MLPDNFHAGLLPKLANLSIASASKQSWMQLAMPQEELAIKNSVPKRKREFRAGRHTARAALKPLGFTSDVVIPMGINRQPIWPDGITGSISHTSNLCVAACARTSHYLSVGVDAEMNKPLTTAVASLTLTPAEQAMLEQYPDLPNTLFFSAKEAIFKAAYPYIKQYFNFQQAELTLDRSQQRFTASLDEQIAALLPPHCCWQGHYRINKSHIVTLACIVMG